MTGVETALIAMTVASTAVSAIGARRQAKAQEQRADYNATLAQQNAVAARQQASAEAQQIERRNRLRLGAIRARAGAAGIQTQGSVLDLIGDTVAQGELERQNALWRGEMQARGFDIESDLSQAEGRNARAAGNLRVAGTLLEGASQTGGQLVQFGIVGGDS